MKVAFNFKFLRRVNDMFFSICLFPNLRECQVKNSDLILMFAVNVVLYLSIDFDLLSSVKLSMIHSYNKFHSLELIY